MPLFIPYLIKLSISLLVVWSFYRLLLRKLTFYGWNRFFLLAYSFIAFFIPFIDISTVIQSNNLDDHRLVQLIPIVGVIQTSANHRLINTSDWMLIALLTGCSFLLCRFVIQQFALIRLKRNAKLVFNSSVKVYEVDKDIIPFSFGGSIFVNPLQHSEEDLMKIIRHEFVHVKQRHSIDMLWAELVCILNWYNPFAWLIRDSIRQNLEFIADSHVVQNGVDKKQYQYLLLKVMGNSRYSIATNFNFTSLKKRIAMMNKMRTARVHLIKFLFIVPLLAVLLLSFRDKLMPARAGVSDRESHLHDTVPARTGKISLHKDVASFRSVDNQITVVLKDGTKEYYNLNDSNDRGAFEKKYGKLPEPPQAPTPPDPPAAPAVPPHVATIDVNDNKATIRLKNGKIEKYDLNDPEQKAAFEKKYGDILPVKPKAPKPPTAPVVPAVASTITVTGLEAVISTNITANADISAVATADTIDIRPVIYTVADTEIKELIAEISSSTPIEQLTALKKQLEAKNYTLVISTAEFNNGKLTSIEGTISDEDSKSRFMADDFSRILIYKVALKSGQTAFNIRVLDGSIKFNQSK